MIFVLLPVFNEEKNVKDVTEECKSVLDALSLEYLIVVVNDGSTDLTGEILKDLKSRISLKVLCFENNQGVHRVFQQGIEEICNLAQENDILISMDCDRTHKAETFKLLIEALKEGNDVAVASRYHKQSTCVNLPFIRALLSDGINMMLKVRFPIRGARDYTTFFRAYRIGVLKEALAKYGQNFVTQIGFSCMAEILIKLNGSHVKIKEVPLDLRFDLRSGKSKMKVLETISGYLKLIFFLSCKKH